MPDKLEERLRRQMEADGLSLRDASRKIGVGFTTVGRILRGGEPYPRTRKKVERWLSKRARPQPADEITRLRGEVDLLQRVIAWANNSLYGSHGFFLSDHGGEPDEHHLDRQIEVLKDYGTKQWRAADKAETALAAKQALIDGLVEGLGYFMRAYEGIAADSFDGIEERYALLLQEGHSRGRLALAHSSGKAGSDA